ncbi:MAG: hypothetical protein OK455_03765 [Thaumarchaeota archaeon]|nr:hypothetical protein [Nitrososphaerota archaeon]
MRRKGLDVVTVSGLVIVALVLVGGFVYITAHSNGGLPATTVTEVFTEYVPVHSSDITSLSNSTETIMPTTTTSLASTTANLDGITTTATVFVTTTVTPSSTTITLSGTKTVTSFSTTTDAVTVTQTVTTTVVSQSSSATGPYAAQAVSCLAKDPNNGGAASCNFTLTDNGGPSTSANGCTLLAGGTVLPGILTTTDGGSRATIFISANGAPISAWCLSSRAGGSQGSQAYGTIALGNGQSLQLFGTWQ